jgi:hypothetical protein
MAGVQFSIGEREFSVFHSIQTGSGALPASYPMSIGCSFLGTQPGHIAGHSLPPSAKVKNGGAIPPLHHMSSGCGV